jgi:hypothetical protein
VNLVRRRLPILLAIASIAVLGLAGSAQAALSVAPTRTFGMGSLYGLASDGTIWTTPNGESSTASFFHVDDEGNNLGDGFSVSRNNYFPLGIGFYGNRVYVTVASSFGGRLISYQANSADPAHDLLFTDTGTDERIGSNQAALRVFGDGSMAVALGQENKVGTFDGKDLTKEHPFYPQAFHGAGINKNFLAEPPFALESCVLGLGGVPVSGEPEKCGNQHGRAGTQAPDGVNYPNDIAFGLGGIYISEGSGNEITHYNTVANPGATLDLRFGVGPGSGAGQLSGPESIVRQPSTGFLYVSEGGNRRISVFDGDGNFIAAFGYGVVNGADEMQVCGIEIGPCQAGVSYLADSRSYFSRLDFAPNGDLYAYMPLVGAIQVFGVSGGPSSGSPGGGSGAPGASGSTAGTPKPEPDKVRIKAKPLKVAKGTKTKLTAIVNPPATCQQRLVLFQEKVPRSWNNLGKALRPGKGCTASKRVKVTAKTIYRAVLIRPAGHATLAYSPNLTVKLK